MTAPARHLAPAGLCLLVFAVLGGQAADVPYGSNVLCSATGAALTEGIGGKFCVLAGTKLIWCDGGDNNGLGSHWSVRRSDGKAVMPFGVADVTDPKEVKVLSAKNVLGGTNLPRHPLVESVIPATWKQEQFVNAKGGRPGQMVHADTCMMPAGNRLFVRTVSHLYAIGDTSASFDGRKATP